MLPDCHLISHVLLHSSLYILLSVAWDLEPETCYMSSSCSHFEHLPDLFGTWFSCLPLWFVCLYELPFWFWPSPILLFHKHIYLHTINPWTISVCLHCDSIDLIHTWWHFCDILSHCFLVLVKKGKVPLLRTILWLAVLLFKLVVCCCQ